MGWSSFALSLAVFAGSHYLPARTGLKEAGIARLGRRAYFAIYGIVSLAVLGWVIVAAGQAPYVALWPAVPWTRWVPNVAVPLALVLAACGTGIAQPHTLGGRRTARVDPDDPGLAAVTRHPLLWALALWAGGHLVANGDLAHVVVFGLFLAMALGFMPVFDARAARALAPAERDAVFGATAVLSLRPLGQARWWRRNGRPLGLRAALGLVLWAVALWLHPLVIGVSPLPV